MQHAQRLGPGHRLGTTLDAELAVDMAGVGFHRVQGDEQALADFLVRTALGNQFEHGHLAGAQGLAGATGRFN
ncbi:hypothetical protein D3C84_1262890 [compost metagenome]